MNNKYFKLLLTERDLFPLVVAIVAFVLSLLGVSSIFDGKVDLNSKYPFFFVCYFRNISCYYPRSYLCNF